MILFFATFITSIHEAIEEAQALYYIKRVADVRLALKFFFGILINLEVAALVRSHMNGLLPFESTIEQ